jgi:CBS domain-containing protein
VSGDPGAGSAGLVADRAGSVVAGSDGPPRQTGGAGLDPPRWLRVQSLTVERLMRRGSSPVGPTDRLAAAAARMRSARVGALVVMEDGRMVGLISERDLLMAVADGLSTDVTPVAAYMRPVPGVIGPAAETPAVASRMIELRARHLPVVRDGQVVGIVSASDLLTELGVPRELLGDDPL